jgi:EF hand
MRTRTWILIACGLMLTASFAVARPPGDDRSDPSQKAAADRFVARMMTFDKNKDGKLTREELTDPRLHRLFDRADANKDGVVTKEELVALFTQEAPRPRGGDDFGPPGGFSPPGGRGFGGQGPGSPGGPGRFGGQGPGGRGGAPQPGQILPGFLQDRLKLSDEQKQQVADLQKEVDARLDKILTAEQKQMLKNLRQRGPGGFGPPGSGRGSGRFGAPGSGPGGARPGPGGPPDQPAPPP